MSLWRDLLLGLGLAILGTLAFLPALGGGYAYDDREAIEGNPVVAGEVASSEAFKRDYWAHRSPSGQWRPLATLSLRVDVSLADGPDPAGLHRTSLALHVAVGVLLFVLLRRLDLTSGTAALAAALFLLHPTMADTAAWISGRTASLAALGGILGLLAITAGGTGPALVGAALAPLLACLAKEDGLLFAPAATLLATRFRAPWAGISGSLMGVGALMLLRAHLFGEPVPSAAAAMLAGEPLSTRLAHGGWAWVAGLRALLLPWGLPPGTAPFPIPALAAAHPLVGQGVALALLLAPALLVVRALRAGALTLGAGLLVICLLGTWPTLQLVPSGEWFAPRFLYLPGLAAASATALFLTRHPPTWAGLLLVAYVSGTWAASKPYTSRESYWTARLEHGPPDAHAWNALGNAALERGDHHQAEAHLMEAIRLDPAYSKPLVNLGVLAMKRAAPEDAVAWLDRAVAAGPRNPIARLNRGSLRLRAEDLEGARSDYQAATSLAPMNAAAWRGLGRTHLRRGDLAAARSALRRALQLTPGDSAARTLLERCGEDGLEE